MPEGLSVCAEEEIAGKKLERDERERKLETEEAVETMHSGLASNGLVPVTLIQGGIDGLNNPFDRPFMVMEVSSSEFQNDKGIFKLRTREDPDKEGLREIKFLETLAPYFHHHLPADLASRVIFPKVHDAKTTGWSTYCVQDYLDGRVAGWRSGVEPGVLDSSDLKTLVALTKYFHKTLTADVVQDLVPGLSMDRDNDLIKEYTGYVNWPESPLPELIGEGNMQKMREELAKYEALIMSAGREFSAGDVNPGNIIKTHDGKIGWIDWERVGITQGPANDYAFMLADFWSDPAMESSFKSMAVEANHDVPYFEEFLRLAYLFQYSASSVVDFSNMRHSSDHQVRQYADSSLAQIVPRIEDALHCRGIWSN